MKLTNNFNREEFDCNDGSRVPDELLDNVIELAENLQVLRDYLKKPIHINSSYRTPDYNKSVGGASKSQHLFAKAADIRVPGMSPQIVHKIILDLIEEGKMKQGGLGLYSSFVHYDVRGTKARWSFVD